MADENTRACLNCVHWRPYSEPAPELGENIVRRHGGHCEEPTFGPRGFTMPLYVCGEFQSARSQGEETS